MDFGFRVSEFRFYIHINYHILNLENLTSEVSKLARQTGEFVRKAASEFSKDSIEYKGLNDLVSYVDKQTEELLVSWPF